MGECCAYVDGRLGFPQQGGPRSQVDEQSGDGGREHPVAADRGRLAKSADALDDDADGGGKEDAAAHRGRENLGATVAEGVRGASRFRRDALCDHRETERARIHEHVGGIGQEGEGTGVKADRRLDEREAERDRKGGRERAACGMAVMRVVVAVVIVSGVARRSVSAGHRHAFPG